MSLIKLAKKLKEKNPNLTQFDFKDIVLLICESIEKALLSKKKLEIRGLGVFFVKKIKEKPRARNPKTSEIIYVPEKNKVRFRSSKKFRDFINQ